MASYQEFLPIGEVPTVSAECGDATIADVSRNASIRAGNSVGPFPIEISTCANSMK
jgi:hypothetical protein